jgi:uncharacterized membrane protein YkvI
VGALEYRAFFQHLLGPFAFIFEVAYVANLVLVLAVFGAAAGALGEALFHWPRLCGTLWLAAGIGLFTSSETLPADFMLGRMGVPLFHLIFQLMIFAARPAIK